MGLCRTGRQVHRLRSLCHAGQPHRPPNHETSAAHPTTDAINMAPFDQVVAALEDDAHRSRACRGGSGHQLLG